MPRRPLAYFLDAGRDRLGHHLEVSELHPARRGFDRGVLFGGHHQQLSASRYRYQDDPHRRRDAQHHHLQGHLRRPRAECLSRTGQDHAHGARRAQFHPVRLAVDGQALRSAYVSIHRGPQSQRDRRARGQHFAHQRGTVVLLPAEGDRCRGRGQHDRERLLSCGVQGVADGICGGGSGPAQREPRRSRGMSALSAPLLEIRDLHVKVGEQPVLRGISLTVSAGAVHAIMGPNGSGKSTLAHVLAGRPGYEIVSGSVSFEGRDLFALAPEQRARAGLFLGFQYPVEIPGVNNAYLLKTALNAARRERRLPELDAFEFLALVRSKTQLMHIDESFLGRGVNEGFSGGEKKRNEILQMLVLEPKLSLLDETDSGLDIDALKVVANGVNSLRSPERCIMLVTHYQRLLDHVVPDFVHVLARGRIVRSGDRTLALELEKRGYDWITEQAAA